MTEPFSYIMTKKSSKRASADVGLMMTAYNLRRIINILGIERFRKYLEDRIDLFFSETAILYRILAHMLAFFWKKGILESKFSTPRQSAIFN